MRRVLITGANRGYGLALAQETLERGDRVFARDGACATTEASGAASRARPAAQGQLTVRSVGVELWPQLPAKGSRARTR